MTDNRAAWDRASAKHVREYDELLRAAAAHTTLLERERAVLDPLLSAGPAVVHLQSGHGLDDIDLVAAGASSVVGVDFSRVATAAAQRRAVELGAACRYVTAELPGAPLRSGAFDLVYTGKGALIWMRDLAAWARDVARLLRPVNDTFPAHGAVEWQWTLGEIVTAVAAAGLAIRLLAEYPEPFWRMGGADAAAWAGRLPNTFALLAENSGPAVSIRPGPVRSDGVRRDRRTTGHEGVEP